MEKGWQKTNPLQLKKWREDWLLIDSGRLPCNEQAFLKPSPRHGMCVTNSSDSDRKGRNMTPLETQKDRQDNNPNRI